MQGLLRQSLFLCFFLLHSRDRIHDILEGSHLGQLHRFIVSYRFDGNGSADGNSLIRVQGQIFQIIPGWIGAIRRIVDRRVFAAGG